MNPTTRAIGVALVLLVLACPSARAAPPPADPAYPADLRWDLAGDTAQGIRWDGQKAEMVWPLNDGCAGQAVPSTVRAGARIDRIGSDTGNYFSPEGQAYDARALPYVCERMDYRVYGVKRDLPVAFCQAAPWFHQPGGAVQYKTAKSAAELVAAGVLEPVMHQPPGPHGTLAHCAAP